MLWHLSIIYSFLFLSSTLLYDNTSLFCYVLIDKYLFLILAVNKAAKNIYIQVFNFSNNVEQFFMYLFAICISSLVKCQFTFFTVFFFKLGFFSIIEFRVLYIFWILVLCQIYILQILSSPSLELLFIFITVSFERETIFILIEYILLIFSLVVCAFMFY